MACPYFYPTKRLDQRLWPHPARLPLGAGFAGVCRADPASDEFRPGESALQQWCNLGYARKQCGRFPDDAGPDAVRFAVSSDSNDIIRIYYAAEKDHRPHQHGPLEFDARQRTFPAPHPNRILQRQAEAYLESYLRRTHER